MSHSESTAGVSAHFPISHFAPWRVDFRRPLQHPARVNAIDDIADQRKLMLPHIMILNLKELVVILLIAVEVFDSAQAMAVVFMEMLLAARRKNSSPSALRAIVNHRHWSSK
jgi:hypothetical protein